MPGRQSRVVTKEVKTDLHFAVIYICHKKSETVTSK